MNPLHKDDGTPWNPLMLSIYGLQLRATSHTRLRARDHYTSSILIGGKGGASPSSLHTKLEGPTKVCECKMDVKSTWIPTWHPSDQVSWSFLTQTHETMALRTLTTIDLFNFIMVEDPHG